MKTTKEQRKEHAVKAMKMLDIYEPYIKDFKEKDQVCFFEGYAGFWADQEPELFEKIKEVEEKYNCTVYAITHEYFEFGECYDFLIVTDYEEEWEDLVYEGMRDFIVYAYVWNKDDDYCSEFGSIGIKSFGGGIRRIS